MLARVEAHGKHLFYVFERDLTVHVHLGLFGRLTMHDNPAPVPSQSTRMRLAAKAVTIDLVGPTACEFVTPEQKAKLLGRIGPDPLQQPKAPKDFLDHLALAATPIGAVLLDQAVISGVGNVYRAEVLHLLKIHPLTPANTLPRKTVSAMWSLLAKLLQRGVSEKRIVTTQGTKISNSPSSVSRAEAVHVYGRNTCLTCGAPVKRLKLNARTAYLCAVCQPLARAK